MVCESRDGAHGPDTHPAPDKPLVIEFQMRAGGLPGGPAVKTPYSQCRGAQV